MQLSMIIEGNFRLPEKLEQGIDIIFRDIKTSCSPMLWNAGIAALTDQKKALQPYHTEVPQKVQLRGVTKWVRRPLRIDIKYSTIMDIMQEIEEEGGIITGVYENAYGTLQIRLPYLSPADINMLRAPPEHYSKEDQKLIKHIKNTLFAYFTPKNIYLAIRHEFIHSLDPTTTMHKELPKRKRKPKIREPYSDKTYLTYVGHGTGKMPVEFNPHMDTFLHNLENTSRTRPDDVIRGIKKLLKHPDKQNIPGFVPHTDLEFLYSTLNDPKMKKIFSQKLYRWYKDTFK